MRSMPERGLYGARPAVDDRNPGPVRALAGPPPECPTEHWRPVRTNNMIERVNREIRRRSGKVGAFPGRRQRPDAREHPRQARHLWTGTAAGTWTCPCSSPQSNRRTKTSTQTTKAENRICTTNRMLSISDQQILILILILIILQNVYHKLFKSLQYIRR